MFLHDDRTAGGVETESVFGDVGSSSTPVRLRDPVLCRSKGRSGSSSRSLSRLVVLGYAKEK